MPEEVVIDIDFRAPPECGMIDALSDHPPMELVDYSNEPLHAKLTIIFFHFRRMC